MEGQSSPRLTRPGDLRRVKAANFKKSSQSNQQDLIGEVEANRRQKAAAPQSKLLVPDAGQCR